MTSSPVRAAGRSLRHRVAAAFASGVLVAVGLGTAAPAEAAGPVPTSATVDRDAVAFQPARTGTYNQTQDVTLTNTGLGVLHLDGVRLEGEAADFDGVTDCGPTLDPGASCRARVLFAPTTPGPRTGTLTFRDDSESGPHHVALRGTGTSGYRLLGAAGRTTGYGDAGPGATDDLVAGDRAVGVVSTPSGDGWWTVTAAGLVYDHGTAEWFGDLEGVRLTQPIVGMAATRDGKGYWLVGVDGGIFSFGTARFFGSTGDVRLNQPIVGMTASPSGEGYWFVAADGGIFSYGDAAFHGSTGGIRVNQPIVGMAATATGQGYWLCARDGGIFAFGDAAFHGSTGDVVLNRPIVGMSPTSVGTGYWFVADDGGIFAYGDAPFYGSGVGQDTSPVVGMAATAPPYVVDADLQAARASAPAVDDVVGASLAGSGWRPIPT